MEGREGWVQTEWRRVKALKVSQMVLRNSCVSELGLWCCVGGSFVPPSAFSVLFHSTPVTRSLGGRAAPCCFLSQIG